MAEPILVVMALPAESDQQFERHGIPVLYTGVGKINAAFHLTQRLEGYRARGESFPLVVNFGSAGSRRFPTHSLVACHRFIQRDMDARGLGFPLGETPFDPGPHVLEFDPLFDDLPQGTCGSADRFEMLHDEDGCDVVDMEAFALAKVCFLQKVRFGCVKYVSDGADSNASDHWEENVSKAALEFVQRAEILRKR